MNDNKNYTNNNYIIIILNATLITIQTLVVW